MVGVTGLGQLTETQVGGTSNISAPMLEAVATERQEAEAALKDLRLLINEEIEGLPDLYKTAGGKDIREGA